MPIESVEKIWMDGELVPWAEAKVHALSHVLHYGSSVFEGTRCYKTPKGSFVFRLSEHIRRLYFSAKIYRMEIPFTKDEFNDDQSNGAWQEVLFDYPDVYLPGIRHGKNRNGATVRAGGRDGCGRLHPTADPSGGGFRRSVRRS